MNPADALALLSNAVSLLQGVAALTQSYDKVSEIIAKRISDKRTVWTSQEKKQILDALNDARAKAIDEVGKLP